MTEFCIHEKHGGICEKTDTYCNLDACPYEDLKEYDPVRRGRWVHETIEDDDWGRTYHSWSCSECKFSVGRNPTGENFCPKCGAKMDLEE